MGALPLCHTAPQQGIFCASRVLLCHVTSANSRWRAYLFVIKLLRRDVRRQQAVGAGVQQALDERLLGSGRLQLKHLESSRLHIIHPIFSSTYSMIVPTLLHNHAEALSPCNRAMLLIESLWLMFCAICNWYCLLS